MDDYMDNQTAADLLDNLIGMVEDNQGNDYNTALKMGIEALKAHTQPEQRWIPCDERLPEPGEYYLVTQEYCTGYREIAISKYYINGWYKADTVLAWCELPKPWDGEKR